MAPEIACQGVRAAKPQVRVRDDLVVAPPLPSHLVRPYLSHSPKAGAAAMLAAASAFSSLVAQGSCNSQRLSMHT